MFWIWPSFDSGMGIHWLQFFRCAKLLREVFWHQRQSFLQRSFWGKFFKAQFRELGSTWLHKGPLLRIVSVQFGFSYTREGIDDSLHMHYLCRPSTFKYDSEYLLMFSSIFVIFIIPSFDMPSILAWSTPISTSCWLHLGVVCKITIIILFLENISFYIPIFVEYRLSKQRSNILWTALLVPIHFKSFLNIDVFIMPVSRCS